MESNALPRGDDSRFSVQRDRLLAAAAHCFNHKGYSGTSLKDVADKLDLTDAALYYYVRNKEELEDTERRIEELADKRDSVAIWLGMASLSYRS